MTSDELGLAAKERIAHLFHVNLEAITNDLEIGEGILSPSYESYWRPNQIDLLDDDIHDVADRETLSKLGESITIRTVGDYCDYMVKCYRTNPKKVEDVIFDTGPHWLVGPFSFIACLLVVAAILYKWCCL